MEVFLFVVSLVVAAVHLFRDKGPRTAARAAEIFLLWLLVIEVGVGGIFGFISHTVFADLAANSIGWPNNPFQTEVAIANLAIGILGILCYWMRSQFWTATVIATFVWLVGDGFFHIQQIIVAHNYSPNNAGAGILFSDIGVPLILVALLAYQRYAGRHQVQAARVT